jgi:hypothetical protein
MNHCCHLVVCTACGGKGQIWVYTNSYQWHTNGMGARWTNFGCRCWGPCQCGMRGHWQTCYACLGTGHIHSQCHHGGYVVPQPKTDLPITFPKQNETGRLVPRERKAS